MNLALATVTACLLFVLAATYYRERSYWLLGSIALLAHLVVGLLLVPRLPYAWDVATFHDAAVTILGGGRVESTTVAAFGTFQALLYATFERRVAVVTVFNALFAVLLPIPASYLARRLYPSAVESTDGLIALVLFAPTPFLFLTIPMRDALSVLLGFGVLSMIVAAYANAEPWPVVASIPLLGMLFLLRPELSIVVVLGGLAGAAVFALNAVSGRRVPLWKYALAVAPAGALGILVGSRMFPIDRLAASASWRAQGGAAYLEWMEYESIWDVVVAAPTRAIFFQYAPFPLQVETAFQALPLVVVPLLVLLTVGAYRSLSACRFDPVVATTLGVVYVAGVVGYGIVTSNFGTAVRHRMPFTFLLLVFAAPVVERWERSLADRFGVGEKEEGDEREQPEEAEELDAGGDVGPQDLDDAEGDEQADEGVDESRVAE